MEVRVNIHTGTYTLWMKDICLRVLKHLLLNCQSACYSWLCGILSLFSKNLDCSLLKIPPWCRAHTAHPAGGTASQWRPIFSRAQWYFTAVFLEEQQGQTQLLKGAVEGNEVFLFSFCCRQFDVIFFSTFSFATSIEASQQLYIQLTTELLTSADVDFN